VLGRRDPHPEGVTHVAEDHARAPAHQDHVVPGGQLPDHRLHVGQVALARLGETLPERRLVLGHVLEVRDGLAELLGGLQDDLPVGELVAERLGQLTPDLVAQAPQGLGNRHDAHGCPSQGSRRAIETRAPAGNQRPGRRRRWLAVAAPDRGAPASPGPDIGLVRAL